MPLLIVLLAVRYVDGFATCLGYVDVEIPVTVAGEQQALAKGSPGRIQVIGTSADREDRGSILYVNDVNVGASTTAGHESHLASVRGQGRGMFVARHTREPGHAIGSQIQQVDVEVLLGAAGGVAVGAERQPSVGAPRRMAVIRPVVRHVEGFRPVATHHVDFAVPVPVGLKGDSPSRRMVGVLDRRRLRLGNG